MILKKLSELIFVDEIRSEAKDSELYFLSHLMDHEMLTLPEEWPSRIYTSQFIFDILSQKKPDVYMCFFRIMQPNVPVKFQSKDKVIMVTMFETGEITHNVMFFFEDKDVTHLYTGIFTEVSHIYLNKHFKRCLDKGIDYIYMDTTRCRGKTFLFTGDTLEEINKIHRANPHKTIAMVIPGFGYEAFLVRLLKRFPNEVYPTKNQRKVLSRLGYSELIGRAASSHIKVHSPGITTDFIQSNKLITIYLSEGKSCTSTCGIQIHQWSPLPSLMNLQELLDITRPRNIVPIKKVPLEGKMSLPPSFKFFLSPKSNDSSRSHFPVETESSVESLKDGESNKSWDSVYDITAGESTSTAKPITADVVPPTVEKKVKNTKFKTSRRKLTSKSSQAKSSTRSSSNNVSKKVCEIKRTRAIRRHHEFEYEDSDEP